MEYQIFSSFYQKDESVRRVFRKKVAHLNELGLSNIHDNTPAQDDIVCRHPKLDLSNDANKAAFYDVGSIQCFGRELFTFQNGVLRFNRTSLRRDVIKKCSYQAVERIDDNYATYTTPLTRNSSPFDMVLQHDFIRVQCYFEVEEHTEYQRSLLSVNLHHGKHLHSVPKRQAEKINLENGVLQGKSNKGILQPIQESQTKMAQRLKQSSFTQPSFEKRHSQESPLKQAFPQKLAKNGTVLSPLKKKDAKNTNKIKNKNQFLFAEKNSLNIPQNQLQKSGAKEKILQQPKFLKHPKKLVKEPENSVFAIPKSLSVQKHQFQNVDQKRSINHAKAKETISNSNTNHRSLQNLNKSIEIHQHQIFDKPHHNPKKESRHFANKHVIKNSGKLSSVQHNSAKNILNARVLVNKTKPISNSTVRIKDSQQPNRSHFVKQMIKSMLNEKIKNNKEIIQLSFHLSKQKSMPKKSLRQQTDPQMINISNLKKISSKKIYKLNSNSTLNQTISVLNNIDSKSSTSQTSKKGLIFFREVNYPELNWKHSPVKKKDLRMAKGGSLEAVYMNPSPLQKSKAMKINRRGNASLWENRAWPFVKPIHKYFKKIPTHLAQLPELKQEKNIEPVNKNSNLSLKISSTKQPLTERADSQWKLRPKMINSVGQPVSVANNHYKTPFYNMIKTTIAKTGNKISDFNAISQPHENQVPTLPFSKQTKERFDIFAIQPKSSEGKKTTIVNDSISYDSSREMYINLPPEDYGINEELPDIEQFFVQIYPKPEVFQRISEVPPFVRINVIPLNILIYGLDSLSHLSFQRKLPLTYKYLKDSLDAVIMNGYNIVGDATTAAIIPLLTGKTETELPEVRKNQLASGFVDDYPLIWNKFRSKGYATLFAEDSPSLAVFNLRFNGFYTAPTDHYMRPFWQAVSESVLHERSLNFCLGSKPKHQFTLDYVMDFFQKYSNVSKFAFAFHGELSHNDNNPVQYLDKDFVHFLKKMQQRNFLNNTLLIVMSDHGARYSNVRNTVQGKLEERLPFMSFVLPTWFHNKYSYFVNNLKGNREKLVTPFDVHETMLDLLDTSRMYEPVDYSTRGISLLQSVPLNRTCKSAGIAMHWCSCLTRFDVNPSTPLVQMSLHKILSYIRTLLLPVKHLCAELSLKKIIYAYLVTPNEKVLKFTNSKDADNRVANFSQQMLLDTVHYQLTFETYPNGGLYEASVQVDIRKESFQVFPEISRLNKYGEQPSCIKEIFPDLRKYCYCKIK